jgi:hypothetical protein
MFRVTIAPIVGADQLPGVSSPAGGSQQAERDAGVVTFVSFFCGVRGGDIEVGPAPDDDPACDDPPEALETTRIHRVAGLTGRRPAVVTTRPCRAPHQSITEVGVIGGGQVPMPGEVPRAHHGVVCLDALPERTRHVLEGRRQLIEESVRYRQSPARYGSAGTGRSCCMNAERSQLRETRARHRAVPSLRIDTVVTRKLGRHCFGLIHTPGCSRDGRKPGSATHVMLPLSRDYRGR